MLSVTFQVTLLVVCGQVKMSQVKQVGLLAAGCQPWNKDVCAASGDRFAYCATLAIYVYQVNTGDGNLILESSDCPFSKSSPDVRQMYSM